ncbi:dynein assembly factor with WD repeat domains 1 isoform X1 [Halyomorpha halys]|uniref:dynein assembly factor with WD repeat domains 1 isoform X1 n=1 Tax=Halyomorpha halys TaxID=286706 RepID=UPI0006D4F123|nr:dynein assembly factor with WDR repeat domains 1 isoform X1 [Halyomorpha halys]
MKLEKFLLRYFPPGLGLEYSQGGKIKKKMINLLDLTTSTDIINVGKTIMDNELLVTKSVKPQLLAVLAKLQKKLFDDINNLYTQHCTLDYHDMPITQVALNKDGSKCITGSFDETCKVCDTETGDVLLNLSHTGIIYGVSFNNPYGDRIMTASFDRTACIWDAETGKRLLTLFGHKDEVLVAKYDPIDNLVGTASMDKTAKIFDFESGKELWSIDDHRDTIISLQFSNDGNTVLTGSFDSNVFLWDKRTHKKVVAFEDHKAEISNCCLNFESTLVGSGSVDKTARVWDVRIQKCLLTLTHDDEVVYVDFDKTGRRFATACSDGLAKVFDLSHDSGKPTSVLSGHTKELSKVTFTPGGSFVITSSSDGTVRLWNWNTGVCAQILTYHKDEVYDCAISYDGSILVTASKDCTSQIFKRSPSCCDQYGTIFNPNDSL